MIAFIGSTISMRTIPGTAPINGPKYGIIFVIPTIRLTIGVNGSLSIVIRKKHIHPIMNESTVFPSTNWLNIW